MGGLRSEPCGASQFDVLLRLSTNSPIPATGIHPHLNPLPSRERINSRGSAFLPSEKRDMRGSVFPSGERNSTGKRLGVQTAGAKERGQAKRACPPIQSGLSLSFWLCVSAGNTSLRRRPGPLPKQSRGRGEKPYLRGKLRRRPAVAPG